MMNLVNIRTWSDARAFLTTAAPVVMAFLVAQGRLSESDAVLWVALVVAIVGPALSAWNTVEGFRKWLYPVVGAVNAIIIAYGIADEATIGLWMPIVVLIVGGTGAGVASANINTSPSTESPGRHRAEP